MNLDQLLDGTLDDLADKPEFKPFPAGLHGVQISFSRKKINGDEGVEVKFKYVEGQELANPNEDKFPEPGTENSIFLNLTAKDQFQREFAQGTFKDICRALAEKFGAKSPSVLMEEGNGATAIIATTVRQNKDKTASYMQLQKIMIG